MYRVFSDNRKVHPRENANIFSILTFFYTLGTIFGGFKKDIEEDDLYDVVTCCKSTALSDRMEKEWHTETKKKSPSLVKTFFRVFGTEYIILGLVQLTVKTTLLVIRPILLGKLVRYFNPDQTEMTKAEAYWYASGVVIVTVLNVVYLHGYMFYIQQLGLKLRISVCSLLYRKSLKLSHASLQEITNGNIVTLMSKDVYSFDSAIMFAHDIWIGVIQIIIMTYIMYEQIGVASIVGIAFLIALIPVQLYVGKLIQRTRLQTAAKTDERIRLIQEILMSIKIIKMYVWEKFFAHRTYEQRKAEMKKLRLIFYLKTIIFSLGALSSRLSFYLCVLVFISFDNTLTAEKAFVVIGCYAALRSVITVSIPIGVSQIAEAKTSVKRVKRVLLAEEVETPKYPLEPVQPKIEISGATVILKDKIVLDITNLRLDGGLIGLTGPVGSGKSTFFKLILQDTEITKGVISTKGIISYASQEPWLFPGTIKQNIVFGELLDEQRYEAVVKMCALRADLENLAKGEDTIVMDKGSNLSKGQQTRINLARAIYRKADIYLLDDSLSNLDAHVSKYIFNNAIKTFLAGKLVVLVSHHKNFLRDTDKIVVLEEGTIQNIVKPQDVDVIKLKTNFENPNSTNAMDIGKSISSLANESHEASEDSKLLQSTRGIYHENKKQGKVDFSMYKTYFDAGGGCKMIILIIALFAICQVSSSWFDYFISGWVDSEQKIAAFMVSNETLNSTYIELKDKRSDSLTDYSVLIIFTTTFTIAQSFTLFFFTTRASINLHKITFAKVIEASMNFFDLHLAGNILNRFSKDMGLIDEFMPFVIFECIRCSFILAGVIIVISAVNPYFLIVSAFLLVILYFMKVLYMPTGRSLKRLENATRSPVVGHINSSLEGMPTIRASKAQGALKIQFDQHQDLHSSASYMYMTVSRAFGFFLDLLCAIFVGVIVLTFVLFDTGALAGKVGLAITQAFGLTGLLQWAIRQWAELENSMTSVERVVEYSKVEKERANGDASEEWPKHGHIKFKNVEMRYVKSLQPVLKNLNFEVQPREKVGIIGRTGAGKSSIISALFKLYSVNGSIIIDGINIKTIEFETLRKKISIIPQDPLLFVGSLRSNLDPNSEYDDEQLWKALKDVDMKKVVESLEMHISDGGGNFSAGQKQLICLARTILRNNKVLVLDEATANVDPETDMFIQKTIKNKFSDCTIIIVAHRLDNVLNCDKVMVLDNGSIVEYDKPDTLLENSDSSFYGMVKQAGLLKEEHVGNEQLKLSVIR